MADNHLHLLHRNYLLCHGIRIFPDQGNCKVKDEQDLSKNEASQGIKENVFMQIKRRNLILVSKFPMFRYIVY